MSKDKRCIVWDVKKGKKHAELNWDSPGKTKYMYKRCKFGCVEGDAKKYKLFTISNPMGNSKAPAFIHRLEPTKRTSMLVFKYLRRK